MLFNSLTFLIFFPVVVSLYYALPRRFRTLLLLLASCYFYMAFVPRYIVVLLSLITMDFFLAQAIEKRTGRERKALLFWSIFFNLAALFVFKYFNFFSINLAGLAGFLGWNYSPTLLSIILPLGLSFHIFQSLSYVIEVYRGRYPTERNFLTYALYVMFFPQLVAGPIERPQNLLPQLKVHRDFDFASARAGLERMLWGFFKKIVIADNISVYVDIVYGNPHAYSAGALIAATVFFAFQVYCDFSGYSDIALGSAQVLGVRLMENFDRPFFSASMAEFWRRWHISLSSWLRDYLYYPLVLSSRGDMRLRVYYALAVTFVLIGLWHGANWTFVAFGAVHGVYMIVGQATEKWRIQLTTRIGLRRKPKFHHALKVLSTFALACFGFIFFRADTLGNALYIASHSLLGITELPLKFFAVLSSGSGALLQTLQSIFLPVGRIHTLVFLGAVALFAAVEWIDLRTHAARIFRGKERWLRWGVYAATVLCIMNLGVTREIPFIYFQF